MLRNISWEFGFCRADPTRERIAAWVALAKRLRPLIATGRVIHVDGTEPGIDVRGIVAADAASAVFTITQTASTAALPPGRIRLPGLEDSRRYRVRPLYCGGAAGSIASGNARLFRP